VWNAARQPDARAGWQPLLNAIGFEKEFAGENVVPLVLAVMNVLIRARLRQCA
jgi:hypothetical protein